MGIGIGVNCKVCGDQLTSLSSSEAEEKQICDSCLLLAIWLIDTINKRIEKEEMS